MPPEEFSDLGNRVGAGRTGFLYGGIAPLIPLDERFERQPVRSTIDHDDVLTLAINVLRDSAECLRMPSGLHLPPEAADLHRLTADWLEHHRTHHCPIP